MRGLAAASVLTVLAFLLAYRFTVRHAALRRAKNRAQAGLLELRIFAEEPRIVGGALLRILGANARVAAMLLPPLALMLPFGWFAFAELQARFGSAPLPLGSAALVTLQMRGAMASEAMAPVLEAPAGILVDSLPVRVAAERQIVWRLRALAPASGDLRLRWPGAEITKRIQAGRAAGPLAVRRSSTWSGWLAEPVESRIAGGPADWVEVRYPDQAVSAFGIAMPWEAWFLLISAAAWVLLRRIPGLRQEI